MPELQAAVAGRDDAALVTVVFSGDRPQVQAVRAATGLRAPVLFDVRVRRSATQSPTQSGDQRLRARYRIDQVPWTLVVNREGRAVEVLVGAHDRERFSKALGAID